VALVPETTVPLVPEAGAGGPGADDAGAGGAGVVGTGVVGRRDWHGSSGKTQLAVSAAEKMWRSGGIDLLIWITASSRPSVLAGYLRASAAALGAPPAGDGTAAAIRFVRWLRETGRRWLVVFDDLTDAAVLDGLWPEGPSGTILITADDPAVVTGAWPGARQIQAVPVGALNPREALNYVTGRLASDPDQRHGGVDLVEALDCEPLAVAQACAVIAGSAQSCRDYLREFTVRRDELAGRAGARMPPAAVTWTLSVDVADQLSPVTAQFLLMLCSVLDGHEIPGGVFTTQAIGDYLATECGVQPADPQRVWADVLSLERAGLITVDDGRSRAVRISKLVQAAVRAVVPEATLDRAIQVAAAALHEVWPSGEPAPWLPADLWSCAASVQRAAGDSLWLDGCHPLLLRAGHSLDGARLTGPAAAAWEELAVTGERMLGPGHPDVLLANRRLAAAHLAAGRPAEAAVSLRQALTGASRAHGPDHRDVIAIQIDLGRALTASGQSVDAVAILADATAACERAHGDDDPSTLGARDELAAACQAAERLDEAIVSYQRILADATAACERAHGDDDPSTLGARDELAAACQAAERLDEAIVSYQRILADRDRIQGSRHPDTITTRQKLAGACLAGGQFKAAVAEHKRAVADREHTAGPDHPDSIAARSHLASAYYEVGRMAAALPLFQQAGDDSERLLGIDHPDTLARRVSLANTYCSVGRLADAKSLLRDTADRCAQVLPPGDPLTQAARESLRSIAGE
jgi:tetratricopeptide (TPR) repeat protein